MNKTTKTLTLSMLAVLLLVAVLPIPAVLASTSTVETFDTRSIYEDLQDAEILGETFDISNYSPNENGAPQLLAFTEFAFTLLNDYQQYYGLYLYLYFPQGNLQESANNTVEMAVDYDSTGEPTEWGKFQLKLLSKDASNVLYKFKVVDSGNYRVLDTFARVAMSADARRYDISSVELLQKGQSNAIDYGIGGTWTITGYGKGMHASSMEESTLQSVATFKNTLKLEVHPTYFRSWRNLGNRYADQLSSVYFSVDNSIDQKFDRLFALDFEAYKYLSSPIFCVYENGSILVNHKQVYENLRNQRGLTLEEVKLLEQYTWLGWDNIDDACFAHYGNSLAHTQNYLEQLAWVFQTQQEFDHKIGSTALNQYMVDFSREFGGTVRGKYNELLFADHYYSLALQDKVVENGKNIGRTITTDESWEIEGSLSMHTFWEQLFFLFQNENVDEIPAFSPIQKVTYNEIKALSNEEISQTYFINETDVPGFLFYVEQQNKANKSVYLFRYDVESFFTSSLFCENYDVCGYVCQEPIYLDFDIISLTYDKAGVKTVMPVVSNPIDIIADLEHSATEDVEQPVLSLDLTGFYTVVFMLVAMFLFVYVMMAVLKFIFG